MEDVWIVLTTFDDEDVALQVARDLLALRLVACVNLLPGATSLYYWKGDLCEEKEVVLLIKTTCEKYPELETVLKQKHPYDEPELLAFPVHAGSEGYLGFVREAVRAPATG